jgi:2-oxoglutarate ferredoxin oxidoreductase subunit alpha
MGGAKHVSDSVTLVGVMEHKLNLFDELMPLPKGTSYNAYIVKGSEKTALIDTVEPRHKETLLKNIHDANVEKIDYIISNHSEQDHSGSISFILEKYPDAIVICSDKAENLLLHEHPQLSKEKLKIVKDRETLSLGDKTLEFIYAPWVHWPETMFTYLREDKTLFTCDFLGAHLAFDNEIWAKKSTVEEPAKRYYAEIMMPFAGMIRNHLKTLESYELEIVCPSHGPIYKKPEIILDLYKDWVSDRVDKKVVIAYVSMHGSTKNMVEHLEKDLQKDGLEVKKFHLTEDEPGAAFEEIINCSTLILASPAYLGGLHPAMANFAFIVNGFKPNIKIIGFVNSFGWGSIAEQQLQQFTSNIKGAYAGSVIVEGHPTDEHYKQLEELSAKVKEMNAHLDNLDQYKEKPDENKPEGQQEKKEEPAKLEEEKMEVKKEESENFFEKSSEEPKQASVKQEAQQTAPPEASTKLDKTYSFKHDVSIVLCGQAGQGIQTIQQVLTKMLILEGYNVYTTKEYMSRVRGGNNSTEIRVSSEQVSGFTDRVDIFVPLDAGAVEHMEKRITENTIIIGNEELVPDKYSYLNIPFGKIAQGIGNKIYANTVAISLVLALFKGNQENLHAFIKEKFAKKTQKTIDDNIKAAQEGFRLGNELVQNGLHIEVTKNEDVKNQIFLSGTDAVGMGAIAGGCNFICSYPMSPSTGVLVFLSGHAQEFGIVAEQAEDEIAAINMGLGAWFAGARAIATTSGGGLALMSEGMSLAGIMESPMVLHIAQRPGPGTGLPTRTGQEDLNLALYSGHGEFPRAIFAPGTLEDGFYLTQHAFNLADRYQVPVFILTDQYYVDTYYNTEHFDTSKLTVEKHIVETDEAYKRYRITSDGVSPRGIPGHGHGLVCLDSDEHDERGNVTESHDIRIAMNEKRLKKHDRLVEACLEPEFIGENKEYTVIIITWGSPFPTVKEAYQEVLKRTGRTDIAVLHYKQVYPIHPDTESLLKKANVIISIEGNATGQFTNLVTQSTGVVINDRILKFNGLQFSVEELVNDIIKRI